MDNERLRRVGGANVRRIEPIDDIAMELATKTMPIRQEMSKISKLLHYQNDSRVFCYPMQYFATKQCNPNKNYVGGSTSVLAMDRIFDIYLRMQ